MNTLKERIDFNFSYKDCETINKLLQEYIAERQDIYSELFLKDDKECTAQDIRDYVTYFCSSPTFSESENEKLHKNLPRILHFLNRKYEVFLADKIMETVCNLISCITDNSYFMDLEDSEIEANLDEFEDLEYENIENIKILWNQLLKQIAEYPLINLDKMEYTVIGGVQVYYNKNISPFIYDSFMKFVETIKKDYPNTLLMMDTLILVSPEYIEFCAGEGTRAFFTEDVIFYADNCPEEDKGFIQSVYYHEFGHYIYSMLSETMMEYWHNSYVEWKNSDIKMSRDKDTNSQLDEFEEELFADTFSTLYVDNGDEAYIHKPSPKITDTLLFILDEEFNK